MTTHRTKAALLGASALAGLTFGGAALAQTAAPPPSPAPIPTAPNQQTSAPTANASGIGEIIVQARRTAERAQRVPVAITPFSAQDLKTKQILTYEELQFNVSGMTMNNSVNRDDVTPEIRGQGNTVGSQFPGVIALLAEVPLQFGSLGGGTTPLYDMSSVQVLKGPQGVAFGRNSTGGAILFYPTRPKDEFGGYASFTYGNYNARYFEGMVNIPVVPGKLDIRAGGDFKQRDGTTFDPTTNTSIDNQNDNSWRISILARPTDWLENYTVLQGYHEDTYGANYRLFAYNPTPCFLNELTLSCSSTDGPGLLKADLAAIPGGIAAAQQALAAPANLIYDNNNEFVRNTQFFLANTTTININEHLRIKNIFGYQSWTGATGFDFDGTSVDWLRIGTPFGPDAVMHTYSDEAQLQGDALEGRLRWIAGVFVSSQDTTGPYETFVEGPEAVPLGSTGSQSSLAGFGQVVLPLDFISRRLSLTAGFRYTEDKINTVSDNWNLVPGGPFPTPTSLSCPPMAATCSFPGAFTFAQGFLGTSAQGGSFGGYNYAVTLNYQATDNIDLYVAHRRGYKGGGFNSLAGTQLGDIINLTAAAVGAPPLVATVKPETVLDVEAGAKTDWTLGGVRGRFNIAGYSQWYTNIVRTEFIDLQGYSYNGPSATIKGVELDATVIPFEGLTLTGYYSFVDAEYTNVSALSQGFQRFPDIPQNQISFSATYQLPLPPQIGQVALTAQVYWQSDHYVDDNANSPTDPALAPGYTLLNAQLNWSHIYGSHVDLSVWGKNLTNQFYWLNGGDSYGDQSGGVINALAGEPRTFGMTVTYTFGGG